MEMSKPPPGELHGDSLEALDPIRFEYKCHIVFDDQVSTASKHWTRSAHIVTSNRRKWKMVEYEPLSSSTKGAFVRWTGKFSKQL